MSGGGGGVPRSPSSTPLVNWGGERFSIGKSESGGLELEPKGKDNGGSEDDGEDGVEGQGLGKQEQGITAPLVAKKKDKRGGVIVNTSESTKYG